MSGLSLAFTLLFYFAGAVMAIGVLLRVATYARTPAPLKIPTTPAPTTATGVGLRMLREVVFFESLFKASLWTWLFGWLFHASLLLVLVRHLRYFTEPVWSWSHSRSLSGCTRPFRWWSGWPVCGRGASWSTGCATSRRCPII